MKAFGRSVGRALHAPAISTPTVKRSIPQPPISEPPRSEMAFPCLDKLEQRTMMIQQELGPEPSYTRAKGFQLFRSLEKVDLDYGQSLATANVAYETWGRLNSDRSNAILIHTGLSASSHAKSHEANTDPGWWEKFIGPGLSIDTNKFFVICTNVLAGCFGSTGPSSLNAATGDPYATGFPIVTLHDMVRMQHRLVTQHLGIPKLYASVGSSMGGMQSLALARDFPGFVGRVASISGCARSHPSSIAVRHVQRQVLMSDPNWNRGYYYNKVPPHVGMKLAREIATITYRSGPEWEQRFGRDRADPTKPPAFCPDFLIETYLDHQGEKFWLNYDANSLLYISKAMDLFDLGAENAAARAAAREQAPEASSCTPIPPEPYDEQPRTQVEQSTQEDLVAGMQSMKGVPAFVLGVQSDVLFPARQQQEIAEILREVSGPENVQYHELSYEQSQFGHDTFLLDLENVGKPLKNWLETEQL